MIMATLQAPRSQSGTEGGGKLNDCVPQSESHMVSWTFPTGCLWLFFAGHGYKACWLNPMQPVVKSVQFRA